MNRSFKKFLVYLLVLSTFIAWATPSFADNPAFTMPDILHELKDSKNLASGVVYENVKKFTSKGWWNINVVRVDLTNEYAEIKGLMSDKGISSRDSISKMVTDNKAIAGVNGDFFDFSPIASPVGGFIQDGQIISSPVEQAYAWPTFLINGQNNAEIMLLDRKMAATSLNSGGTVTLNMINKFKPKGDGGVVLYNEQWGSQTPGNKHFDDWVEVVVDNDVVTDIRIGQSSVELKEDRYVIAARDIYKDNLLKFFKVGDQVKLNITVAPDLDNIKFAIGGSSIILKNGVPMATHYNAKGNNPRTGIGITEDGKELIIATIDGRDTIFQGVSQEMFGAILKSLGAYNAINFDGGGSTTMAIKPLDEQMSKVVNKPSDGSERKVVNGVGVFSNAPKGELSYLKVNTDDMKMFIDTSRRFTVKGYDEYHNPIEIDQNKVVYTFEGIEGEMEGNLLKARSSGNGTVFANYEGITGKIDLKVLDEVKDIILPLDKFNVEANSQKNIGTVYGKDGNGFKAKIYNEDIDWSTTGDIGHVENSVFYSADKSGAGAITARIGQGSKNILVSIGSNSTLVEGFEKLENFKFTSHPDIVKGDISLSSTAKQGNNSIRLQYDFSQGDGTRAAYLNFAPSGLSFNGNPVKLGLWVLGDGNGSWLRGSIKDKNGQSHMIDFTKSLNSMDWQYVEATIPSNISYPVVLERIYVVETNGSKKHSGEVLIDGLTAHYPISYDGIKAPTQSVLTDSKNTLSEKSSDGFSFIITKAPSNLDKIAGYNASSKIQAKANDHNVSIFMAGGVSSEFANNLKSELVLNSGTNFYVNKSFRNVRFIDVNSSKGGIRPQNPEQWKWLKNDLNNATEDHIVLMLTTPIFGSGGFKDQLEAELLHNILIETHEKGKNILVVHGGSSSKVDLKDGIRYIGFNNKGIENQKDINDIRGIEFVVNGNNITYQINQLFR